MKTDNLGYTLKLIADIYLVEQHKMQFTRTQYWRKLQVATELQPEVLLMTLA